MHDHGLAISTEVLLLLLLPAGQLLPLITSHTGLQASSHGSCRLAGRQIIWSRLTPRTYAYSSHVCITFTLLHEPTFREDYERLWRPASKEPEPLRLCLAHAVFALGALFSDRLPAEESESLAETCFVQAKELCELDNLDEGSLTMIQALLLMGHYLHVKRVSRCWHIFGLAIRMAQGQGLPLSDINNKCGVVERETRKRCWCGCLVMDTMLAVTFGRPTMIPPEFYDSVDLPEPVHDGQITTTGISPRTEQGDSSRPPTSCSLSNELSCALSSTAF